MVRFEKNPSGGCLTNGNAMVGVKIREVPGGNARRPSSVIHINRFLRECGCCESVSINSSCSRSSANELPLCVDAVSGDVDAADVVSVFVLAKLVAWAISPVSAMENKTIFEVFSKHSHVEVMLLFVAFIFLNLSVVMDKKK